MEAQVVGTPRRRLAVLAATAVVTVGLVVTTPAVADAYGPGAVGAAVDYPPFAVADNRPAVTSDAQPRSGSLFPVGVTTVTGTATDTSGNTTSTSFTVTVTGAAVEAATAAHPVTAQPSFTG
jgi:hypothetical protein